MRVNSGRVLRRFLYTWGLVMYGQKWSISPWAELRINDEMWLAFLEKYGRK